MKKALYPDRPGQPEAESCRENNWCEKYGYFIDLDACRSRSFHRPVCRRCYKSLLQTNLPFEKT